MTEIDGITYCSVRAQVLGIEENGRNERPFKRQKSERTAAAELFEEVLHLGSANGQDENGEEPGEEGVNGCEVAERVSEFLDTVTGGVEDIIRAVSPGPLQPQIGPQSAEEVFENNIMIKHPDRETEGIELGLHLSKHKKGYRVRRVLRHEFIQSGILRVGDIIKMVRDIEVTSLPIETLKGVFWALDFEAALTLVILRKPEDEPDGAAERSEYKIVTVSLELQKDDTEIKFTAEVVVQTAAFETQEPSAEKYFIAVKEGGDTKYLRIQDEAPKMEQLIDRSIESDYYWRIQITTGSDWEIRFLFLHHNTQKTICCDLDPTQDVAFVKLSSRGFLPKGPSTEVDMRWVIRDRVEGEPSSAVYYMRCSEHQDFYMRVDEAPTDQGRLLYARDTSQHPKRQFFFYEV